MFERLKKLWKQTVAWFRPEGGSATPVFKTYDPPPARARKPAGPPPARERAPAAPNVFCSIPPEIGARMSKAERLLGLDPPPPDMDLKDRVARAEEAAARPNANRAMRRKLERARRRHDKFVQPKGAIPAPIVATARKETPKPLKREQPAELPPEPDEFDDPNDFLIADEWLEGDGGGDVLFEVQECFGEFNFRDTILDQLERYWVYLARMRKHDKDAYEFYKVMGATLVPYMATGTRRLVPEPFEKLSKKGLAMYRSEIVLPPWFKKHWPSFGCIAYGTNPIDEASELAKDSEGHLHATPKFLYFRRVKSVPWMVQPVLGGHVYILTVWWDRPHDRKANEHWGRPCEYPFHINDDGTRIRALKTRKHSNGNYGPWWDWQYPDQGWSEQYGLDCQTHLTHIFTSVMGEIEATNYSTVRVEVTKGELTAVFGISPSRTSYFFQDRDIILAPNGCKRRIFHFVRPHIRKDGSAVRAHFRGLREFTWANYKVKITVPGLDHFIPMEFNPDMVWDSTASKEEMLTEGQVALILKQEMSRGLR